MGPFLNAALLQASAVAGKVPGLINDGVARILVPIAIWILISGADDLLVDALCAFHWICYRFFNKRRRKELTWEQIATKPERPIAIFLPLWHEHEVIGNMVRHNYSAIKYRNYRFFIGAYPNDEATLNAVRQLERQYPNVHLAMCPHDGPTSKADCLNWIYQRMLRYEAEHGDRFEVILTHDAEDLIHPEALGWINWYMDSYEMIQIPVLPLPTPIKMWTHGIYCDEFCENQMKDLRARQMFGTYIPSCGVGTGFVRSALEKLARESQNRIFDPGCLTEDYENGIRLHLMGARQIFVKLRNQNGSWLATREFFPQKFRNAVRQRTRWITGISLQGWERHGWKGGLFQKYWFWRDRKGLIGNPVSLLTNLICLYGIGSWAICRALQIDWAFGRVALPASISPILTATLWIGLARVIVRAACVCRVYGFKFAMATPLRVVVANVINSFAAVNALFRFARAKIRREPLVWLKTEHEYPSQAALHDHRRRLGEVLVGSDYITEHQLQFALETQPADMRLGEYLVRLGYLHESDLYDALSLQLTLPVGRVYPRDVAPQIARSLPKRVAQEWKVLPFKVESGQLYIAGSELPSAEMQADLKRFTSLEIRFQLITPANYEELREKLL